MITEIIDIRIIKVATCARESHTPYDFNNSIA